MLAGVQRLAGVEAQPGAHQDGEALKRSSTLRFGTTSASSRSMVIEHTESSRGIGSGQPGAGLGPQARLVDEGDRGHGHVEELLDQLDEPVEALLARGVEHLECIEGAQTRGFVDALDDIVSGHASSLPTLHRRH